MSSCYNARFVEKSEKQKQEQHLKTLSIFYNHVNKQLKIEEELYTNYRFKLNNLEEKKNHLLNLIQGVQNKSMSKVEQKSPIVMKSGQSLVNPTVNATNTKLSSNYLSKMNELKNKDLVEQMSSLIKQLTTMIDHNINNSLNRQSNKLMSRSTLMINSMYIKRNHQQLDQSQLLSQQLRQFVAKHMIQMGTLSRLPTISPIEPIDQVIQSLLINLQKQQSLFLQKLYRFKHLQMQKIVRQHLQEKTVQNMRMIYNMNKIQEERVKRKQYRSTRDIVKFGYTEAMLQVIKQRAYPKRR